MAVLIEALNVVVLRDVLRLRYPGGEDAFFRACPNDTLCVDDYLARVGFMHPDDVGQFCDQLEAVHFKPMDNYDRFLDLAVVDQMTGPTRHCPWLDAARHVDGFSFAWKGGTEPGWLSTPRGWTVEQSRSMKLAYPEDMGHYLPLRTDGLLQVWLDLSTGTERYLGRTRSDEQDARAGLRSTSVPPPRLWKSSSSPPRC
jgi:hypothetical protein